jgi:arylformamidase
VPVYDISRRVSSRTAVWPGDQPYRAIPALRIADGDSVNLMTLTLSPHTGAHADAALHAVDGAADAASMPIEPYLGPARLITVSVVDGGLVPSDLPENALTGPPRLLIRSAVSGLPEDTWPAEFPYLTVELVAEAARNGFRLIGLDSPSVDAFDSKTLPCHHALVAHGIVNLESLCFADVADGDYELIALPLRLHGACASPVRAILRDLKEDTS